MNEKFVIKQCKNCPILKYNPKCQHCAKRKKPKNDVKRNLEDIPG